MATEFADSNRGRIAYKEEIVFGTAQGSLVDAQIARITSSGLIANKGTTVSDELRADRMVSDLIETDFSTGGDLSAEWSLGGTWNEFLRAALCTPVGQLATPYSGTSLTVGPDTAVTGTVTSSPPAFIATNPGDWIWLTGFSNETNNGWRKVLAVGSTAEVTVGSMASEPLINETAAQPDGSNLTFVNGVEKRSYSVEQFFSDVNIAQLFLGQRLGTWSMNVASGSVVTATWGFMGSSVEAQTGPYVTPGTGATTTEVVGATANVAEVFKDDEKVDCQVQSITLNLDNGLRAQNAVGDKFPCGIGYGRQTITGSMTVYFQNLQDYTDFLDHADIAVAWTFVDLAGNSMRIKIPRAKYTAGSPALEGVDTDVTLTLDFQALALRDIFTDDEAQIEIADFTLA